ncbi:peptidylprolyl isomerase [Humitalea sp. 24SJ18S-53]|uniref:peptidylprolyl isomerase n=1 Tax=Humitalea sp. 24SJ18S-53 TaxID=3422307 RepID=UPI003D6726FC
MRLASLLLLTAGLLGTAPLSTSPASAQTNRILAVVNGDVVTQADVTSRARLFALNSGAAGAGAGFTERLSAPILRLLVDERLRAQEVARRRVPVTDGDVAESITDIERRNNVPPGGLVRQLRGAGVEPRTLFEQIRVQIGWSRLLRALLGQQATPGETEVNEFIAARNARTGQPEFLVSEIFIPLDDPTREPEVRRFAEDVIAQLRSGVPFPIAATQFSQSQTALAGGDMGWVNADQLDPDAAALAQRMPVGAISNAIRVPGGFQILALRQRRETGVQNATVLSIRQAFLPFQGTLDPANPTQQQRDTVERAGRITGGCPAVEVAARGSPRPADPGPVAMENLPPPLRTILSGLAPGRVSQPLITPDGVLVIAVCERQTRNMAEVTPDVARQLITRDRLENISRQQLREARRRAQIEIRAVPEPAAATPAGRG